MLQLEIFLKFADVIFSIQMSAS